ncbi:hypothetical protein B0H21DRAFT_750614 [Amylocystis lapponica]|nr:hypothetical protein B0H21DRAFT_750614 [Amylocystis lapponica]
MATAMSTEAWKRVPTTTATVLGITLPYRPPRSALGTFFWRKRMWFETTVGFSLLEPWEKIMMIFISYFLLTLVGTGLYKIVPPYFALLESRAVYYLLGQEAAASAPVQTLASWAIRDVSGEL